MKIQFLKSKSPLLLTLLFYAGIGASALLLFLVQNNTSSVTLAYTIVGITFFTGIIAVTSVAQSAKPVIVYLEKKNEAGNERSQQNTSGIQSQLNTAAIAGSTNAQHILNEICKQLQAGQGAVYKAHEQKLSLVNGYALNVSDAGSTTTFEFGEGLIGRVAVEASPLYIDKLPENYITIFSGLGSASPKYLVIVPVKTETELKGVLEIALFTPVNHATRADLLQAGEILARLI